jgi:hypothetical protein
MVRPRSVFTAIGAALGAGVLLAVVSLVSPLSPAVSAQAALTGSDFQAGNIISNEVMYFTDSMTASSIQSFLTAKGGTCKAGYTCLSKYKTDTQNRAADSICGAYKGAKAETAATIIYKSAQACHVNPQALIVTLEKEQSLVSGTSPTSLTYRKATGYGCSDSANCDKLFYGFYNQVFLAAKSFQRVPSSYLPGKTSKILYSPAKGCTTKSVKVENKATSRLYTYTPYTPNKAALADLKGTGDKCSSYGNRNFWRIFNTWFGSSVLPQSSMAFVRATYQDILGRSASDADVVKKSKEYSLSSSSARIALGKAILTSTEARTDAVKAAYLLTLGRAPSSADAATWVKRIVSKQVKQDDLIPTYLASDEFYKKKSGGTTAGYVTALYQQILGRNPDHGGLASWTARIEADGRLKSATSMWHSVESEKKRANEVFTIYLRRGASAANQATNATYIAKHSYTDLVATVLGSAEYLTKANTRFPFVEG